MGQASIAEELKNGKTITYFTLGISMRPLLIERKTHVRICPLTQARENDILLYIRENGSYVLHRLVKQEEDWFYMRGDNTFGPERIRKEQAIGVVTQIYRKGKYIEVETNRMYQWYVRLWRLNYPLRYVWFQGKSFLRQIKHKTNRNVEKAR